MKLIGLAAIVVLASCRPLQVQADCDKSADAGIVDADSGARVDRSDAGDAGPDDAGQPSGLPCLANIDCPDAGTVCDLTAQTCVEQLSCKNPSDCAAMPGPSICDNDAGVCVPTWGPQAALR